MFDKTNPDAFIVWSLNDRCNLNCKYCGNVNNQKSKPIRLIKIDKLQRSLDETKKSFLILFSGGGEPFLVNNLIDACEQLTINHKVCFNTNLTTNRYSEFSNRINPKNVLYIIGSLHIKEIEKKGLVKNYIKNFILLKNKGFNIIPQVVAHPELNSEIKKYIEFYKNYNIELTFTPFYGTYRNKKYPDSYTEDELKLYNFTKDVKNIYYQKGNLCNVGHNCIFINCEGKIVRCAGDLTEIGNIYDKIKFNDYLTICPYNYCPCPVNKYNPNLFNKALKSTKKIKKIKIRQKQKLLLIVDNYIGRIGIKINKISPDTYKILNIIKSNSQYILK